jgi:type IV pilus assembly protein PilE
MNASTPQQARSRARLDRGFTLIELMVTMVIAAILLGIAIPAYNLYVLKGHRTDAKSALVDLASLEERYFSTQNTYTSLPSQLGYGATPPPFPIGSGATSYYNITAITVVAAVPPTSTTTAGTPASYSITATAIGTQLQDTACYTFTITSGGVQTATTSVASGSLPNNAACWAQ